MRRFRSTGSDEEPRHLTAGRGIIAKIGGGLAVLSVAIFIFGVVVSNGVKEATAEEGAEELEIDAIAQQWLWRFEYPEQAEGSFSEGIATIFSYGELVVPVDTARDTSTSTRPTSSTPGPSPPWARRSGRCRARSRRSSFIADEEGLYRGRSTVFSGAAGYPVMRANVRVVSAEEYEDYIEGLNADLQEGQAAVQRGSRGR